MEHVIGGIGTVLVLAAYFLVSTGRLQSYSIGFQGTNLLGAALLTVYGVLLVAWASVALNAIWALIAIAGLVRGRRERRRMGTVSAGG